jgi:crotonobetainyl-CoA:carnitine CoA-transferase CaiB-like acyl-CoA transferase
MTPTNKLFSQLTVVELAGVLAGPSVGHFFAELGARVIKIENPKTGGDVTRSWKLKSEDGAADTSAYFWSVNAFKEFLCLDLENKRELEKLYDLLKTADIVITNYKKGDPEKLEVDYETIKNINPGIIYASISGFGEDSPRTAYDLVLQAESGFMSMNGEHGSKGLKMPVALIDILAGHQLKEAILIGLLSKASTGKGCNVSVSLFDSAIASLANQATNWLIGKEVPAPSGSLHPNIAPYGELFDTKDKHMVTFAIGTNKQFKALCEVIGYPGLATQPAYATNHSRVGNRKQLYAVLSDYIKRFDFAELYKHCLEHDIPIGKLRNLKEVFALPEAKEMLREMTYEKKKFTTVSGIGFKLKSEI